MKTDEHRQAETLGRGSFGGRLLFIALISLPIDLVWRTRAFHASTSAGGMLLIVLLSLRDSLILAAGWHLFHWAGKKRD